MILTLSGGEGDLLAALAPALHFLLYLFSLAAAGAALFVAGFGRLQEASHAEADRRLVIAFALGGAAAAWCWLATQVGVLSGGDLLDGEIWTMALGMGPGWSVLTATAGLATLGAAAALRRLSLAPVLLGSAVLAASFTLVGHTSRVQPRALLAALLVIHLLGAAFWTGSLWPLARASRPGGESAARLVEAWARVAGWVVPALVVAGLLLAWLILGRTEKLVTTTYGWVLILKAVLVGVLLAFAAWHRFQLTPALAARAPGSGQRLRRSILLEIGVMVAVLWTVSELTSTTPLTAG